MLHTRLKLDEVHDLGGSNVQLNRVIDFDEGVGVADGAAVVRHQVGHVLGARRHALHLAQLVLEHKHNTLTIHPWQ